MNAGTDKSNFLLALVCGTLAAVAMVAMWAYITYYTGFQIGWMAVGVGCVIGLGIRYTGKGTSDIFGFLGAALAFFACFLGNLLSIVLWVAFDEKMPVMDVFQAIEFKDWVQAYISNFHLMDLMFYGLAVFEAFKLSIVQEERVVSLESISI